MFKLDVIIASTRPGRVGLPIGNWFVERAKEHGRFEVVMADLKEVNLPMFDEPKHPRFQQYEHEHTKVWSAIVDAADAFVIVTPEYNYGLPPALVNAFDYVYKEWNYKPAGFVSYGGISGGMRSVQMSKMILTAMKVMPIPEAVAIPFFSAHMKEGKFEAPDAANKSATSMLDELHRWTEALKPMRG